MKKIKKEISRLDDNAKVIRQSVDQATQQFEEIKTMHNRSVKLLQQLTIIIIVVMAIITTISVIFAPTVITHWREVHITEPKLYFLIPVVFVFASMMFSKKLKEQDSLGWWAVFLGIIFTLIGSFFK